eukprot:SAG11_NODE_1003_length_6211_cov_6.104548_5_plen_105_part_00
MISADEIAMNSEAQNLARMIGASLCSQLGCTTPTAINIESFAVPGCNEGASTIDAVIGRRLQIDTDYLHTVATEANLVDGVLTSDELATSPNASQLADSMMQGT